MKLSAWGVKDRQLSAAETWLSFAAIFMVAVLAAFNMFKASPAIQYIAADINMPQNMISQIMGSYSLPALIFAYPGMWITQKFGFKFASVLSAGLMGIGSIICLGMADPTGFLVGRVAEGVGYGIICVVGPNAVPRLFKHTQLGLSMGIWSQWIPVGTFLALIFAPMLFAAGGGAAVAFSWRTIWIAAIVIEIVIAVLCCFLVKMPAVNQNTIVDGDTSKKLVEGKNFMAGAIVVSLGFIAFAYINVVAINTMYPTFLQNFKGMDVAASSMFTNIAVVIAVVVGIATGVIADKFHCRKWLIVIGYIIVALCAFFLLWSAGTDMTGPTVGVVIYGICSGAVPTCTRAIIPNLVVDPKKCDFALTTMGFLMALGKVIGGYTLSPAIAAFGYTGAAQFVLAPMCLVAGILVLIFVKSDGAVHKLREAEREASRRGETEVKYEE